MMTKQLDMVTYLLHRFSLFMESSRGFENELVTIKDIKVELESILVEPEKVERWGTIIELGIKGAQSAGYSHEGLKERLRKNLESQEALKANPKSDPGSDNEIWYVSTSKLPVHGQTVRFKIPEGLFYGRYFLDGATGRFITISNRGLLKAFVVNTPIKWHGVASGFI